MHPAKGQSTNGAAILSAEPEITFRAPKASDLKRLVDIYADGKDSEKKCNFKLFADLIPQKRSLCVLADDKIVGLVYWYDEFLGRRKQWYMAQIIMAKKWRGKGVGQKLLKRFLAHAKRNKVERVFCDINNDNYPSLKIALKSGGLERIHSGG